MFVDIYHPIFQIHYSPSNTYNFDLGVNSWREFIHLRSRPKPRSSRKNMKRQTDPYGEAMKK